MLPDFETYYRACYRDSVVLAKEETNRSMEQNQEPRNRPRQIESTDL